MSFDGTDDYIAGSDQSLPASSAESSVSFWFKAASNDTARTMFSWGNSNAANARSFGLTADNKLRTSVSSTPNNCTIPTLRDDEWQQLTVSYAAGATQVYLNGQFLCSQTQSSTVTLGSNYTIGRSASNDQYFDGVIDHLQVRPSVLSSAEIEEISVLMDYRFWTGDARGTSLSAAQRGNWVGDAKPDQYATNVFASSSDDAVWDNNVYMMQGLELRDGFTGSLEVPQQLQISGEYHQSTGTTLVLTLDSESAYGSVQATGDIKLGGNLTIKLDTTSFTPVAGTTYTLFDGTTTGGFDKINFAGDALPEGLGWDLTNLYVDGTVSVIEVFGAVPYTPELWLAASDAGSLNLDTAQITRWTDKSGKNHSATQNTSAKQPALVENILNGYPIAQFDGTDDVLNGAGFNLNQNFTLVMVSQVNNQTSGTRSGLVSFQNTIGSNTDSRDTNGISLTTDYADGTTAFGHNANFVSSNLIDGFQIISVKWDQGQVSFSIDGTTPVTSTMDNSTIASTLYSLGARSNDDRHGQVDIAELLVFDETLTDNELRKLIQGLTAKYGVGFGDSSYGLVAHYPLDETSGITAADISGHNYHGNLTGGISFNDRSVEGKIGGALLLDNTLEDGIEVNTIPYDLASYTYSLWFKSTLTTDTYVHDLINLSDNSTVRLTENGHLAQIIHANNSWVPHEGSSSNLNDNLWHHAAITFDEEYQSKIYLDGILIDETTLEPIVFDQVYNKFIGRHVVDPNRDFVGLLDDVRIYDRPLSDAEVQALSITAASILPVCGSSTELEITFSGDLQPVMATKIKEYVITPYDGGTALTVEKASLTSSNTVRLSVQGLTPGTLYNVTAFADTTRFYLPGSQGHYVDWTNFQLQNMTGTYYNGRTDKVNITTDSIERAAMLVDGVFIAPYTGNFVFNTYMDDWGQVWYDGQVLTHDTDTGAGNNEASVSIALTKGQQIRIRSKAISTAASGGNDIQTLIWTDMNNDGTAAMPTGFIGGEHWQNCAGTLPEFHQVAHALPVCDAPERLLVYFEENQYPSSTALSNIANYSLKETSTETPIAISSAQRIGDGLVMLSTEPLTSGTGYTITAFGDEFKLATGQSDANALVGQYFDQDTGAGKGYWYSEFLKGSYQIGQNSNFETGNVYEQGDDFFSVRWQGSLKPTRTGNYRLNFSVLDDGARVYINGQHVLSNWGNRKDTNTHNVEFPMVANQSYPIRVDFVESTGGAGVQIMMDEDNDGSIDDLLPASMMRTCMPISALSAVSLLNHWPLDETTGTTTADVAGSYDLAMVGGNSFANRSTTNAIKGTAVDFDGSSDRIVDPDLTSYTDTDVTLSAWVKYDTTVNVSPDILSIGNNHVLRFNNVSNGTPTLAALTRRDNANSWYTSLGVTELSANTWYHLAYRFNTDTESLDLYVNGELDASYTGINTFTAKDNTYISIGSSPTDESFKFDGTIDEVMLFGRALTSAEIKSLAGPTLTNAIANCSTDVNTTLYFDGNLTDFDGNINNVGLYSMRDLTAAADITLVSATQLNTNTIELAHTALIGGHQYLITAWGREFTYTHPETKGYFLDADWYDQTNATSYFTGTTTHSQYEQVTFASSTAEPETGVGNTEFSGRFTGMFVPPRDGLYQFRLAHSDGARVWVNGSQVINQWTNTSDTSSTSGSINLSAGVAVPVRIDMQHDTGPWQLEFRTQVLSSTSFDVIQGNNFRNCTGTGLEKVNHAITTCGMDTEVTLYFQDSLNLVAANTAANYTLYNFDGSLLGQPSAAALQSNDRQVVLTVPSMTAGQVYKVKAFGQSFIFAKPLKETEGGVQVYFDQNQGSGKVSASDGGLWTGNTSVNTGNAHISQDGHYIANMGTAPVSVKWTGLFTPPVTGTYDLRTYSSSGLNVQVDNTQVINHWDEHNVEWNSGDILTQGVALTANEPVPFTVEHWQADVTGHMKMDIEWPSTNHASLMQASFMTCKPNANLTPVATYAAAVCGNTSQVLVMFNRQLPASAANVSNYSFTSGVTVNDVEVLPGNTSVLLTTSTLTTGQNYKVTAFDTTLSFVGSDTAQTGIYGGYFNQYVNGATRDSHYIFESDNTAAFNGQVYVRKDQDLEFNWTGNVVPVTGLTGSDYSVRWQGSVVPTATGTYTFDSSFDGDETLRVWVDNTLITDDYKSMSSTGIEMEAGLKYPIRIDYLETGSNSSNNFDLQWSQDGGAMSIIPGSALRTCASPLAAINQAELTSANSVCNSDSQISLYFDEELAATIAENPAYYRVSPTDGGDDLTITAATLGTDIHEVTLTVAETLTRGATYQVAAFDRGTSYYHAPVNTSGLYTSYFANLTHTGAAGFTAINDDMRAYFHVSPGGTLVRLVSTQAILQTSLIQVLQVSQRSTMTCVPISMFLLAVHLTTKICLLAHKATGLHQLLVQCNSAQPLTTASIFGLAHNNSLQIQVIQTHLCILQQLTSTLIKPIQYVLM